MCAYHRLAGQQLAAVHGPDGAEGIPSPGAGSVVERTTLPTGDSVLLDSSGTSVCSLICPLIRPQKCFMGPVTAQCASSQGGQVQGGARRPAVVGQWRGPCWGRHFTLCGVSENEKGSPFAKHPCCSEKLVVGVTESSLEHSIHLFLTEWDWNPGSMWPSLYSALDRVSLQRQGLLRCLSCLWYRHRRPGRGCAGCLCTGLTVFSNGLAWLCPWGTGSLAWD